MAYPLLPGLTPDGRIYENVDMGTLEAFLPTGGYPTAHAPAMLELPDGDLLLGAHETPESVFRAAEKLGYDLGAEDQQKVWKRFLQTVERKKSLTLRELDAIIAAAAMQAPRRL